MLLDYEKGQGGRPFKQSTAVAMLNFGKRDGIVDIFLLAAGGVPGVRGVTCVICGTCRLHAVP